MTKKIFRSILLASTAALMVGLIIVTGILYEYFTKIQKNGLTAELNMASAAVEQNGLDYLNAVNTDDYRLTWVAADGSVLYDSQTDAGTMENHADREEIKQAFETGSGDSERYSSTLTAKTLYSARRLSDGTVLRISVENATVFVLVLGMLQPIIAVFFLILILSAVLANRMAKRVVNPLNSLDLEHPLENDSYEELSPLLRRINQLHRQVNSQLKELRKKQDEFEQITGSMSEGLVLLDNSGCIISVNASAAKLFNADKTCIGDDFITVDRTPEVNEAIEKAITDGHCEIRIQRGGQEYQLDVSRIESDGNVIGTVLLAFDVTNKVFAERNRREFTANVSHELKTPLQSIMGSAELIENGLVKPEDMPRFVEHIRSEASRLVALIEDIIRLSQLDEEQPMERENVDLYDVAKETVEELEYSASEKNIKLNLTGGNAAVEGVRKLLAEIVFNLCDNAIKYNSDGGTVDVDVSADGDNAVLTVKDNGIGIPPEHQSRIFERFYRVDKSHSKESGGTGLGLSIVKHAVMYHHGTIELKSEPGNGTEFTVKLPCKLS